MAKSAILSVNIVGDGTRAAKAMSDTERRLNQLGKSSAKSGVQLNRMFTQLDKASSAALKVGALSTVLLGATSAVAHTAAALAPLVGLTAALPGIAGAGAAGFATLKVATSGFGEAVSAAAEGEAKFLEATKGMAPSMVAAARSMHGFNTAFAATRTLVQENFWSGVSTEMTNLGSAVIPVLNASMSSLASSMNGAFLELLKVGQTKPVLDAVGASFSLMQRTIDNLTPALAPFISGLSQIITASANMMGGFTGAATAAQAFNTWATRISTDGTLVTWFNNGKTAASQLWDVLAAAGSILASVGRAALAAGSGGGLGAFATALQSIATEIARPEIQTMLTNAFTQAGTVIRLVTSAFLTLLPYLIQFGPAIMVMAAGWKIASTAMALYRGAMMASTVVMAVAKGALVAFRVALVVARAGVLLFNAALMANPVGLLVIAVVAVIAAFVLLYNKCAWFRNGVNAIVSAVANHWRAVWAMIVSFVSSAISRASSIMAGIGRAASTVGRAIGAAFRAAGSLIRSIFSSVVSFISGTFSRIGAAASAVGRGVGAAFRAAGSLIRSIFSSVVSFITSAFSRISSAASSIGSRIGSAFRSAVASIKGAFSSLVGFISGIFSRITGLASGAASRVAGVFSRIRSAASSVGSAVSGLFSSGTLWVKAAVPSTLPDVGKPFYMTAASSLTGPSRMGGSRKAAPVSVVQVTVNGAIDPNETARQIKRILSGDSVRSGYLVSGENAW